MKNVTTALFFAAVLFLTACNNEQIQPQVTQEEVDTAQVVSIQPQEDVMTGDVGVPMPIIDTAKILTWDDYSRIKSSGWDFYSNAKSAAWNNYSNAKSVAWDEYSTQIKTALEVIRSAHKDKYLEWLDAEKMSNYNKKQQIEQSPEFAEYIKVDHFEYQKYKTIDDTEYQKYKKIDEQTYEMYKAIDAMAYEAYKNHKKD